jgi:hypothetical protein
MAKMLVLTLGYERFALPIEKIGLVKELAQLQKIRREHYSEPYFLAPDVDFTVAVENAVVVMTERPVPAEPVAQAAE